MTIGLYISSITTHPGDTGKPRTKGDVWDFTTFCKKISDFLHIFLQKNAKKSANNFANFFLQKSLQFVFARILTIF